MKKAILIVLAVGMLGWAVYDFISPSGETSDVEDTGGNMITSPPPNDNEGEVQEFNEVGLSLGQIAPDFELTTLEGEPVRLSDYRGQRVIVNFWATWCPPCREEIPDLQKLYDEKDVEILAVDLTKTEESEENVRDFADDFEMTFPVPMDVNSEVATTYQVRAYPTSYMIDSNGRIQFSAMGAMDYDLMVEELSKIE
ncbi:TlpA family protein disulfide reductase [Lentibacillus amyloliquefaciens]|uniref:Alkyl hydroperoxide reductase n=1 Tax=Lentibacillus amyloliquefaciens TaxID=1472767 RepID=A0A0U3NQZ6_9BACI|nr:TlpA disulfide reductase family protein [Lentibacillus amyloliquefaciens]ALX49115.1 alkyl hydroperoxide reductase [Lentibacillus amyloliquefaciens]